MLLARQRFITLKTNGIQTNTVITGLLDGEGGIHTFDERQMFYYDKKISIKGCGRKDSIRFEINQYRRCRPLFRTRKFNELEHDKNVNSETRIYVNTELGGYDFKAIIVDSSVLDG